MASPVVHLRIPVDILTALDEARGDESRSVWILGAIGLRLSPLAEAVAAVAASTAPPVDASPPGVPVTVFAAPPEPAEACTHPKARVMKGFCGNCGTGGL